MADVKERKAEEKIGSVFGWISGLGAVVIPWVAAGVLSSFTGAFSEAWNPEVTFPRFLLGAVVVMIGWLVYGSVRLPGFWKGAMIGGSISFGLAGLLATALYVLQP